MTGADSFTFKVSDGKLDSNAAKAVIIVKKQGGNDGGGGAPGFLGLPFARKRRCS